MTANKPALFRQFMPLSRVICLVLTCAVMLYGQIAQAEMEPYPVVKLRSLDKISARTKTFEARVGSTVKYGPLFIKIQTCRKAPPIEKPESAAFLQIWEITPEGDSEWVFSGWMFASSPALSSMDHPVYDVWVLDCLKHKTGEEPVAAAKADKDITGDETPAANDSPSSPEDDNPAENQAGNDGKPEKSEEAGNDNNEIEKQAAPVDKPRTAPLQETQNQVSDDTSNQ